MRRRVAELRTLLYRQLTTVPQHLCTASHPPQGCPQVLNRVNWLLTRRLPPNIRTMVIATRYKCLNYRPPDRPENFRSQAVLLKKLFPRPVASRRHMGRLHIAGARHSA